AQHAHHLTVQLEDPLLQLHALSLSPIQRLHIEGIPPIEARRGEWRRVFGPRHFALRCSPFQYHERRACRWCGELHLHPEGIEVRGLSCSQPQLLRFLLLLAGSKSTALDTKGKQALEMLDGGRAHATLPLPNGLLADTKEPAQFSLGQMHALAQLRTRAHKGVLPMVRIGMR